MSLTSQISPGVNVREIDTTTYVQNVSVSTGGFVGQFNWGPMNFPVNVSNTKDLEVKFLPPINSSLNAFIATSFLSCLNFLTYPGGNLWVVRAYTDNSLNATSANTYISIKNQGTPNTALSWVGINNYLAVEASVGDPKSSIRLDPSLAANVSIGWFVYGNNISNLTITDANNISGIISLSGNITSNVYTTDNLLFNSNNPANTVIIQNEVSYEDTYLYNDNLNNFGPFVARYAGSAGDSISVSVCSSSEEFPSWNYRSYFTNPPGTSRYAYNKGSANDEMHIVVVDTNGRFSGTQGSILEKFSFVSKAFDAIDINGAKSYYKQTIFENSNYIYAMGPVDYANSSYTWDRSTTDVREFYKAANYSVQLNNGFDGNSPSSSNLITGWNEFKNKDAFEVNLCFTGDAPIEVHQHLIDNVIEGQNYPISGRRDSMVFISPRYSDVVNTKGNELTNILESFLPILGRSSSYAVVDSGWKYQLDPYNNIYRWVPLNADIAGLCAQTDLTSEAWYSPAGFKRGLIKNVLKLAWNPVREERDALYMNGVNPVVTFTGTGPVLFGDKTLLSQPSAFDRINVRRLFITLEKAISQASMSSLFELNDQFTRSQFIAMVDPYLRDIQAKNGIYDYLIVCDQTNNTSSVIDNNGFVGDIYIKPTKSINFIQLNFVAVGSSVSFNTIEGKF